MHADSPELRSYEVDEFEEPDLKLDPQRAEDCNGCDGVVIWNWGNNFCEEYTPGGRNVKFCFDLHEDSDAEDNEIEPVTC